MFKAGTDCGEPTKKSVKRVTFSSLNIFQTPKNEEKRSWLKTMEKEFFLFSQKRSTFNPELIIFMCPWRHTFSANRGESCHSCKL